MSNFLPGSSFIHNRMNQENNTLWALVGADDDQKEIFIYYK